MIHILATCRKLPMLRSSTLVFDTIRVGFPDEQIHVTVNTDIADAKREIVQSCEKVKATYEHACTVHHKWIRDTLERSRSPLWICDTDMVFFNKFDASSLLGSALAGTFTPRFMDPFSKCMTMERLHTCLLYMHPRMIQHRITSWQLQVPETKFTPKVDLIDPLVIPTLHGNTFFDTCSLLYQAIGGQSFNDKQLASFAHLHCGTWADMIEPVMPGMLSMHKQAIENPEFAKNLRKLQSDFYAKHAC